MPLLEERTTALVKDMISVRGRVKWHHMAFLKAIVQRLMMMGLDNKQWAQRVRAAYSLLDSAFSIYPEELAPLVFETIQKQGPVQMEASNLEEEIRRNKESRIPDARFSPVLTLYAALYEGTYPTLAAPVVKAHQLLNEHSGLADAIKPDGRVYPPVVERLEDERMLPRGLLTQGLNRHLRNCIAHRRQKVRSRDIIELEDRNARGVRTWGPVQWSYEQLRKWPNDLQVTCFALRAALVIFDVNKQELAVARGFVVPTQISYRFDVIDTLLHRAAPEYGFEVKNCDDTQLGELLVELKVVGETQVGQSEILAQYDHGYAKWVQDAKTLHLLVADQVARFCGAALDLFAECEAVRFDIKNWDSQEIGHLIFDSDTFADIASAEHPEDPVRFAGDTVGEATMPFTVTTKPRFIGGFPGQAGTDEVPEQILRTRAPR